MPEWLRASIERRVDARLGRINRAILQRGRTWPFVGYRTRGAGRPWLAIRDRKPWSTNRPLILLVPAFWHRPYDIPPCDPTPKD